MLDGMRDILKLDETLKDWKSPKIVVIGSESSGKSSLLERLMMFPLLPRDKVSFETLSHVCETTSIRHSVLRLSFHAATWLELLRT